MHEDQAGEINLGPQRHDRWSVLMVGLSWMNMLSDATGQALESLTVMTAQHACQLRFDKQFNQVVEKL
jgi:hypothetical protein